MKWNITVPALRAAVSAECARTHTDSLRLCLVDQDGSQQWMCTQETVWRLGQFLTNEDIERTDDFKHCYKMVGRATAVKR